MLFRVVKDPIVLHYLDTSSFCWMYAQEVILCSLVSIFINILFPLQSVNVKCRGFHSRNECLKPHALHLGRDEDVQGRRKEHKFP